MNSGHFPGTSAAFVTALLTFFSISIHSKASSITLQGSFTRDDDVQLLDFTVPVSGSVDLRSYGYAGGLTSTGQVVSSGGFDTVLTLFTRNGTLITDNDDGPGVAVDPSTGMAADARIMTNLTPGTYTLALTQYDNFANSSTLAGGFNEDGHPNFTASLAFTSTGPCPGNLFRDISDAAGHCRNADWTVDFINVSKATPVPEPSGALMLGAGIFALGFISIFRKKPSPPAIRTLTVATALLSSLLLWPAALQAQTDFSRVGDILDGRRQLLQIQDLMVGYTLQNSNEYRLLNFATADGKAVSSPFLPLSPSCFNNPSGGVRTRLAGRLYQSDHDQIVLVCNNQKSGSYVLIVDGDIRTLVSLSPPLGSPITVASAVLADFSGTGYKQLALVYTEGGEKGVLMLLSAAYADGTRRTAPLVVYNKPIPPLLMITAGDFNGDGRPEIAGLQQSGEGRPPLVIYAVDPKTLVATKAAQTTPTYPGDSLPVSFYSITPGKFTAAAQQQLVLAAASGKSQVKFISFDFAPSSLQPVERGALLVPGTGGLGDAPVTAPIVNFIQVQAARFAWQGSYDQVAFQYSNFGKRSSIGADRSEFIAIYKLNPTDLSFQQKSIVQSSDPADNTYPSPMALGNFDNSQLVNGKRQYNPGLQIVTASTSRNSPPGQLSTNLNIFNVDPATFRFDQVQHFAFTAAGSSISNAPYFFLGAADLQARSYVLGDPTKVTIQGAIQPSVIAGMPPMHIDYITPAGQNTPTIFNFSADPAGFNTSYQTSSESKVEEKNTDTISWSAGAKLTVGATLSVGNPNIAGAEVQNTFSAAQDLKGSTQKEYGNFQSQSYSRSTTTGYGDFLMFSQQNFYIWIYPVIGRMVCPASKPNCRNSEKLPMTIQFSAPGDTKLNSLGSATAWYQPPWEPGNILSYPANLSQLKMIYPNLQLLSKDSYQWFTDSSKSVETTSWNTGSSNGTTSTLEKTFSFENDFSVSGNASVFGVGVGASVGVNVSGSSGLSSLRQSTTAINQSTGIGVTKNGGVKNQTHYQYGVTSYFDREDKASRPAG